MYIFLQTVNSPAQKLYFDLGYSPNGTGITYKGEVSIPGQSYPLDDDLILWLVKDLISSSESCKILTPNPQADVNFLLQQGL